MLGDEIDRLIVFGERRFVLEPFPVEFDRPVTGIGGGSALDRPSLVRAFRCAENPEVTDRLRLCKDDTREAAYSQNDAKTKRYINGW